MRAFSVVGRVTVTESREGIPDLIVAAVWIGDAGAEARGGAATTDASGQFAIAVVDNEASQLLRVRVTAPVGSQVDKPLAVSEPRLVTGSREEFQFWIGEAALEAAGVPSPPLKGGHLDDPVLLLNRAVGDQRRRQQLDQGIASVFTPRLDTQRKRVQALRTEVRTRILNDLGIARPGRPRVVTPGASVAGLVAASTRDALETVRAGKPATLRLAITAAELDALRIGPGTTVLDTARVEALVFAHGPRARIREDAIARYCAQLTHRLPVLDPPNEPPAPPIPSEAASDMEQTLARMVDDIARRTAPIVERRSDDNSISERLRALDLSGGPADRVAFFDYGTLVGTVDGVWAELIDDDVVATATDLYEAVVAGGGRVEPTEPLISGLAHELHALHTVATGATLAKRPPTNQSLRPGVRPPGFLGLIVPIFPRTQVQDHRSDRPPSVVAPAPTRARLWPEEPETAAYDELLTELNDRLAEPHTFQVFAADGDDRAFDFGLFVTYRQRWEPRGHQAGSLVKTVTLAPREERSYITRTTYKRATSSVQASNLERADRTETQDTMRSASDIVTAAKSSLGFEVTAEGSVGIGELFSADTTTKFNHGSEQSSQETRQFVREAVRRAAQEAKSSIRTEVTTNESTEIFTEEAGKISNPNEELPVTYLFYELQRRFRVSERVHHVVPVVMVARAVPRPDQITRTWLFTNGWVLRRVLLDAQFEAPLAYLLHEAAGVEARLAQLRQHRDGLRRLVDTLTGEVEQRVRESTSRYGAAETALNRRLAAMAADGDDGFVEKAFEAVLGGSNSVDVARLREQVAKDAHERALRAESDARDRLTQAASSLEVSTKEHSDALARYRDSEIAVTRLRVHVKQHILHYMRALWNAEDRDQRFFELHSVRVPRLAGHLRYSVVERPGTLPTPPLWEPPHTVEATLMTDEADPMSDPQRLGDVADLDHPIGYKGNFQVFPMRQHNVLTRFLMLPYIDHRVGACDPELRANFTISELDTYVACARQALPRAEFAAMLPAIQDLYRGLLDAPFPDEEEVVVPTASTFIEALPGSRPVLEDYRLLHRAIDVSKAAAEVRKHELDNLRRVALIRSGQLGDPDIETVVVTPPGSETVVNGTSGPTPENP